MKLNLLNYRFINTSYTMWPPPNSHPIYKILKKENYLYFKFDSGGEYNISGLGNFIYKAILYKRIKTVL